MDINTLCKIGLNKAQALAYKALVQRKGAKPSTVAKLIGETRSNTYAILDRLVDMGLAYREDVNKKYTYYPESPQVLESILIEQISSQQADLELLKKKMPKMLGAFHSDKGSPSVKISSGIDAISVSYKDQVATEDRYIRFIRSIHDIGYMGFERMKSIRYLARENKKRRLGITPHLAADKLLDERSDSRTSLRRRWLDENSYTAPVEWVVSGDNIWAVIFKDEGYVVELENEHLAESLRQIFDLFYEKL
ncbi:MAG: helix-turn-helix domain-containing protein [Patescibacteria group bacterium]